MQPLYNRKSVKIGNMCLATGKNGKAVQQIELGKEFGKQSEKTQSLDLKKKEE